MVAITFGVLSVSACAFLIYVLAQFHRELVTARKGRQGHSKLSDVALLRVERALQSTKASLYAGKGQQTTTGAVRRREILIGEFVGLFGLVALFVCVMLLNSSSIWHH